MSANAVVWTGISSRQPDVMRRVHGDAHKGVCDIESHKERVRNKERQETE